MCPRRLGPTVRREAAVHMIQLSFRVRGVIRGITGYGQGLLQMPYGPNHPDSAPLRAAARLKIACGLLPSDCECKLFAGYGHGESCAICDRPIRADEVQYEIEPPGRAQIPFHMACHAAWLLECESNRHGMAMPEGRGLSA
jgi:hypothetical protein